MNIKQSTNNGALAQKLNETIMKEIENRVQTSVVKKFAVMGDKIDKVLELIDELEQTTCTELNKIKSLLYEVRNESLTCTSQQTHAMPIASESYEKRVEPWIAKSFDLETNLTLESSVTSNKTINESSIVHARDTSTSSYVQYKDKLPDPLKTYVSKANLSLKTSRVSLNPTILPAERSQPTKTIPNPPIKHGQPSSSASDGETKGELAGLQLIKSTDFKTGAEKSEPTKTMLQKPHRTLDALSVASQSPDQFNESRLDKSTASKPGLPLTCSETPLSIKSKPSSSLKPGLLHALKRLNVSKATSKPFEPSKTMPQAAVATAAPVKSISVASIKENRRQNLNERIIGSSESSLKVSKHQNTNGAPQQKSQEVVADLSICHPEFLDLSESNTSTFIKSSKITGTQQKLIHDVQNEAADEYILPSNPFKKDEYNSVLSSSKPEPYGGLFDFSAFKISATSTPVRRTRPVPLPRSGSKNSSVTMFPLNVPSVNQ